MKVIVGMGDEWEGWPLREYSAVYIRSRRVAPEQA
jgi:hypothetical protein